MTTCSRRLRKIQTPEAALVLLKEIGVTRTELDPFVRVNEEFQRHCDLQTERYRRRAAAGDARAMNILKDRSICDERGRWIRRHLSEAVSILRSARTLRAKSAAAATKRILNCKRLMFDTQGGSTVWSLDFFTVSAGIACSRSRCARRGRWRKKSI